MFGSIRNRFTKFSILGFALAITSLTLGVINWSKEGLALYFIVSAIILFIGSVFLEGYGIYRAKHFFREDAQEIYQRAENLIVELKTLALVLHKDYGDRPDKQRKYAKDERYKQLMKKFARVRLKCSDYKLERKLHNLVEQEKLMAKYRLNTAECKFQVTLEEVNQDIRNYINTRFKMREVL